ncbi:MAG: long-chain fatty acid--CoA ligase [Thermodesulfobacteriota bacterium]|nr:long-chain fatty acid--CoA ligase [Thermodesulfobacteriota bacterium]
MNLGRYISRSALYYPDSIALIYKDKRFSYEEFDLRTNRLAQGLLSIGLQKGDPIAIQSWNRSEIVETEVACYKAGFVRVPMNARLSLAEATHVLNNAEAKTVIVDPQHLEPLLANKEQLKTLDHFICLEETPTKEITYELLLAESKEEPPLIEVEPSDVAVLSYSSGTTGRLKAIVQTFGNRMAMIRKAFMIPDIKIECGDIFAHVGPITHSSGMLLMPVMFSGGCNLILSRFDVEMLLETIQRERVNYILLVPAMINMILSHPKAGDYDLSSLKGVFYGAAPMSTTRIQQAIEFFGPILVQGYGMSETTSFTTILTAKDHLDALQNNAGSRLASCGRPIFESEVKVVDENGQEVSHGQIGEVIIRGPDVMKGYFKEPELTKKTIKNGWIHSGDMAKADQDGYIYIVDRKSDTIISGGFNVYPTEVEQILYSHPSVYEACIIGVPDDKWGEAVKAVVTLKQGCKATEEELIEHCKRFLAGYKKPQSVDFVNELPKNPNGKIARRLVREKYWIHKERRVN